MPNHNTNSASKSKKAGPSSAAGGGRSAVTGKKVGKAAGRAIDKSYGCVEEYIELCERPGQRGSDLTDALAAAKYFLARVTRTVGGGRVVVLLMDGREDVSVKIGGSVTMRGKAATKTDRSNCMCQGDLVVVRGAFAAGKLSPANAALVASIFADRGVTTPRGFFGAATVADVDDAFEFDRSDQLAAEEAEVAAVRATAARKSALRSGVAETVAEGVAEATEAVDIDAI